MRQRLHFPPPVIASEGMAAPPFFPVVNPLWVAGKLLFSVENRNFTCGFQRYPRRFRNLDPLAVGMANRLLGRCVFEGASEASWYPHLYILRREPLGSLVRYRNLLVFHSYCGEGCAVAGRDGSKDGDKERDGDAD